MSENNLPPGKIDHDAIKDGDYLFQRRVIPREEMPNDQDDGAEIKHHNSLQLKTLIGGLNEDYKKRIMEEANRRAPLLWKEIDQMVFSEDQWRIKNLIPREGIVMLASVSGERKTWVAMEMARCIATGINFLDTPEFKTTAGKVLYIDAENAKSEIQRRGRQLGFESAGDNLMISPREINFNDPDGDDIDWLREYVEENNICSIFIDTLRGVAGGLKEEKAEEVRKFFNLFRPFKDSGVAVIILDHCRKPNNFEGKVPKKEQVFSSQDKVASSEILLMLRSENGNIELYQRKNRLGREIKPFVIKMTDTSPADGRNMKTELTFGGEIEENESKKETAKSLILTILSEDGRTRKEILEIVYQKTKIGQRNVSEALRELEGLSMIETAKKGRQNYYFIKKPGEDQEISDFP
jgi:DNA-binding transcriptional ArsR family regulator